MFLRKKQSMTHMQRKFPSIVEAESYVDKSLLIHKLFYHEERKSEKLYVRIPKILITAPRRFGKSVNMDMIKCF